MPIGTSILMDYMRENPDEISEDPEVRQQEQMMQKRFVLEEKKRRKKQIMQQMLRDAGYGDIVKMVTPRERNITYDNNDN